jgi:DNA processing protein
LSKPADLVDRLRLIRTPGIGPVAFRQLLLRFGSAEAALAAIPDLARRGGGKVPSVFPKDRAEREIASVEKLGARYLSLGQGLYPAALAALEDAPPLLIAKGRLELLDRPLVAIVGARNASAAACRFARGLAHGLGQEGVSVVSGLARGTTAPPMTVRWTAERSRSSPEGSMSIIRPRMRPGSRTLLPAAC